MHASMSELHVTARDLLNTLEMDTSAPGQALSLLPCILMNAAGPCEK